MEWNIILQFNDIIVQYETFNLKLILRFAILILRVLLNYNSIFFKVTFMWVLDDSKGNLKVKIV